MAGDSCAARRRCSTDTRDSKLSSIRFSTAATRVGVIEHFWCAPYARALRPHCDRLVLDLHNIESELARTHALATGACSIAGTRFAACYQRSNASGCPNSIMVLVASEEDRRRVDHPQFTFIRTLCRRSRGRM